MKRLQVTSIFFALLMFVSCSSDDRQPQEQEPSNEAIYFPPLNSDSWETKTMSELNWNETQFQPLLEYLQEKNSKSFMILHEGKIVVESYFDGHTNTSPWYWASAGKTLTTAVTGIAQSEGLIAINSKVSDYIGNGWTNTTIEKEDLITCKNLLSMTSGLDDSQGVSTAPSDLNYAADAGDRWAYHTVFFKLQDAIAQASNENWDAYFDSRLKIKIGMTGAWIQNGNSNVYWSTARSMARFGLLNYANGKWETDQIIPEDYLDDAINTSQNLNEAYGYMWWLNGKTTYMLPQNQVDFSGTLIPNAPNDMYAALGKNDQKLYVVPSKKLVIIRMGNATDNENFGLSDFDNQLWLHINALIE